ncbi:hypothetical protein B566_EDAN004385 [Ephemera danica]|nr:hypothetical protein B566_EDAN004385 [Ephemera danica]
MKKHKKHKGEKKDRYDDSASDKPPALKLILKVGGGSSSTPEHSDSPVPPVGSGPSGTLSGNSYSVATLEDESSASLLGISPLDVSGEGGKHKKAKKKKKKKDREKHERKHKHHHKERRKRPREESSQDDISLGDDSTSEVPAKKATLSSPLPVAIDAQSSSLVSAQGDAVGAALTAAPQAEVPGQQSGAAETGDTADSQSSREPRTCVLRQRQEHTPLYKLLDYLLKALEKKDQQHFFAWPVTDNIAPGYSSIISQPMDFSTMRQKNEDNLYASLPEFLDDFKLMCQNAMVYNQQETIYYRAAKRLQHGGLKICSRDKLRPLIPTMPYLSELTVAELGFELHSPEELQKINEAAALATPALTTEPNSEVSVAMDVEDSSAQPTYDTDAARSAALEESKREARRKNRIQRQPLTKFEAIPDDLTPEEVLAQVRQAAQNASEKLALKKPFSKMGFLRTNKDGTTSLAILCGNSGVAPGTNEQAISLGSLAGKLPHGTGQLAGFREDKRNMAKTVKPLYYGAFGSYAPSYDSTFANLTKEESDLVYSTYGDETGFQYAESILDFARDSDYTLRMVDELLDLLTGGEHSRTMNQLGTARRKRVTPPSTNSTPAATSSTETKVFETKAEDGSKIAGTAAKEPPPVIDMDALKGLSDLGIDMEFLSGLNSNPPTAVLLTTEAVQASLDQTSQLIGQLQKVQRDRLSQPPPPHLSLTPGPSESEVQLAEKITDNLTDLAKQVTPEVIAPACVVRKAMGIDMVAVPPGTVAAGTKVATSKAAENKTANGKEKRAESNSTSAAQNVVRSEKTVEKVEAPSSTSAAATNLAASSDLTEVPDLESELREFLENTEPTLSSSPLQDEDRTIEEILSES